MHFFCLFVGNYNQKLMDTIGLKILPEVGLGSKLDHIKFWIQNFFLKEYNLELGLWRSRHMAAGKRCQAGSAGATAGETTSGAAGSLLIVLCSTGVAGQHISPTWRREWLSVVLCLRAIKLHKEIKLTCLLLCVICRGSPANKNVCYTRAQQTAAKMTDTGRLLLSLASPWQQWISCLHGDCYRSYATLVMSESLLSLLWNCNLQIKTASSVEWTLIPLLTLWCNTITSL